MSLIAKPGMGKTTILFQLLSQLEGSARTVFLFQTLCSPKELLRGLLRDLGVVDEAGDVVRMQEQLNNVLLAEARQGRRVVVVIDEAQNLKDSALELVRMLSNFETTSDKLMQIILAGQPQLREKLASPHLIQLRQRMSIFARLHPFSVEETQPLCPPSSSGGRLRLQDPTFHAAGGGADRKIQRRDSSKYQQHLLQCPFTGLRIETKKHPGGGDSREFGRPGYRDRRR